MFVLYALYSSLYLPRHHVTPGADQHSLAVPKSITPTTPTPHFPTHAHTHFLPTTTRVNVPSPPHPTMPTVQTSTALQRETKPNWKETKWPHAAFPVKALDRPEKGPPEEGSVEDDDDGDNKSSCCVTAQLHFGPCLSIWLFRSIAERTDSHACHV